VIEFSEYGLFDFIFVRAAERGKSSTTGFLQQHSLAAAALSYIVHQSRFLSKLFMNQNTPFMNQVNFNTLSLAAAALPPPCYRSAPAAPPPKWPTRDEVRRRQVAMLRSRRRLDTKGVRVRAPSESVRVPSESVWVPSESGSVRVRPGSVRVSPGSVRVSPDSVRVSLGSVRVSPVSVRVSPVSVRVSPQLTVIPQCNRTSPQCNRAAS